MLSKPSLDENCECLGDGKIITEFTWNNYPEIMMFI